MHRLGSKLAKHDSEQGFSLVEVLVSAVLLIVGLVMMSQLFTAAASRVLDSDVRTVMHELATKELESIRGLPYTDVGTVTGHPKGTLIADEDKVVQNVTLHIQRSVVYWTDPTYSGPYLANYRRVTVKVTVPSRPSIRALEVVSNVAGGAIGGTLDITVTDIAGTPIADADIAITNTNLVPNVNIHDSAMKTNALGRLIVPALDPDSTPSYVVTASKPGYNTAFTSPGVVVVDGVPYTVVQLKIDRLSTMVVKVVDTMGVPVTGMHMRVQGPELFNQYFDSTSDGVTLSNIRYSTDLDPYIVRLTSANVGYAPQDITVVLMPGATQEVTVTVPAGGPTTTTTAVVTTTTTTGAPATLRVTVYKSGTSTKLSGAVVTLSNGMQKTTPSNGLVVFNLTSGTYGITVTKTNYYDYSGSAVVSGSTSKRVDLILK